MSRDQSNIHADTESDTEAGKKQLEVHDLGRIGYREALEFQRRLNRERAEDRIPDQLLLLEHPPVITMGKSAPDHHVLATPEVLVREGVEIHRIERGGEVTYHGPGQIVGYVIINLRRRARSVKRFVSDLEQVFIDLLETEYEIEARRDDQHRGVWVGPDKIAAVGIAIKNHTTLHGFAFNVNTDLEQFGWIVPCGITSGGLTSLERLLGRRQDLAQTKAALLRSFTKVFGYPEPPPTARRTATR